jgi:hypothetical protein
MTTYYKIRYKDDPEKYIKGTPAYQSYDKNGRMFASLGQLRTFLTSVMNADSRYNKWDSSHSNRNRVAEWEVVEYELTEKEVKGIHEVITAKKLKDLLMK